MYKAIDLFAGAGGLSLGFKKTGRFEFLAAAEINLNARATYMRNIPSNSDTFTFIENIIGYDFAELNRTLSGIDVVIGGPPCQGFSNANRQKNQLINSNNALVKEYFRAIKEIQPRAFVMENVSMLESDIHRFYDSEKDHDEIEHLRSAGFRIQIREDELFISADNYAGFDMLKIAQSEDMVNNLILPNKLYTLIRTLNKNKSNDERLVKFLNKNQTLIINNIANYMETAPPNDVHIARIKEMLQTIIEVLSDIETIKACDALSKIVDLQKNLTAIKEIYINKLIGQFQRTSDSKIVFRTKSYAVIDYIKAILGDQYIQKGATLNAEWFGVPQERKRHIIIGIKKEPNRNTEIIFPTKSVCGQHYTVGDAIKDLSRYSVGYDKQYEPVPYNADDEVSEFAGEMRMGSTAVKNHITTNTTDEAMKRFKVIEQGKNFHSLEKNLKTTYSKPERTQNTIYLRLNPKQPSGTVVNVRKSMWIHPTLDRAITVREAARLQSFPDYFEFIGTKDSQYQQVGNAVPPKLAEGIADIILNILD